MQRIFILSPAKTTGKRAQLLFSDAAAFDLATRLREDQGVPLGEVFSFLSGLYFRGKLTYARHFGGDSSSVGSCWVITSDAGLVPCDELVSLNRLRRFAETAIDPAESRYRAPLEETARAISGQLTNRAEVVLLGSIATGKYVEVLHECFGERLVFPQDFIGRGDMSRGGLLLRAVQANTELEYASISAVTLRTGRRPPKLAPLKRIRKGEAPAVPPRNKARRESRPPMT